MDSQFAICPHCGCPATSDKMVLSFDKKRYFCTNHKHTMVVKVEDLRCINGQLPKSFKQPLTFPAAPTGPPREHSVSWEVTRRARWEGYLKKPRYHAGKKVEQDMQLTDGELLMNDKSGNACVAVVLDRERQKEHRSRQFELQRKNKNTYSGYIKRYSE